MTTEIRKCLQWGLCYTCGDKLTKWRALTMTPQDAMTHRAGFPASHTECARKVALESDETVAVWIARQPPQPMVGQQESGEAIGYFHAPRPDAIEWYALGRAAFRDEIILALKRAIPALLLACDEDPDQFQALGRRVLELVPTLPRASSPGVRACVECRLNTNDQQVLGCTKVECPLFGEAVT